MIRLSHRSRITSYFIVFAFLAMSLVVSFHWHTLQESKASDHCQVCYVGHQIGTGTLSAPPSVSIHFVHQFYSFALLTVPEFIQTPFAYYSQAPPLVLPS